MTRAGEKLYGEWNKPTRPPRRRRPRWRWALAVVIALLLGVIWRGNW